MSKTSDVVDRISLKPRPFFSREAEIKAVHSQIILHSLRSSPSRQSLALSSVLVFASFAKFPTAVTGYLDGIFLPVTVFNSPSVCLGMADSLCYLSGQSETFGDQIVPDTDDCFLAPADVSSYSSHVSVVC